jgi:hypothetical protein
MACARAIETKAKTAAGSGAGVWCHERARMGGEGVGSGQGDKEERGKGKDAGEERDPLALLLARNLLRHDIGDLQSCRTRGGKKKKKCTGQVGVPSGGGVYETRSRSSSRAICFAMIDAICAPVAPYIRRADTQTRRQDNTYYTPVLFLPGRTIHPASRHTDKAARQYVLYASTFPPRSHHRSKIRSSHNIFSQLDCYSG